MLKFILWSIKTMTSSIFNSNKIELISEKIVCSKYEIRNIKYLWAIKCPTVMGISALQKQTLFALMWCPYYAQYALPYILRNGQNFAHSAEEWQKSCTELQREPKTNRSWYFYVYTWQLTVAILSGTQKIRKKSLTF